MAWQSTDMYHVPTFFGTKRTATTHNEHSLTLPLLIITCLTTYISTLNSPSWGQASIIVAFLIKPLGVVTSFPLHGACSSFHHLQFHPLLGFPLQNPPRATLLQIYNSHPWTSTFNRLGHSRVIWPHPLHFWHWMPLGNLVGSLLPSSLSEYINVLTSTLWFLLIRLLEILILLPNRCLSFSLVLT